MGGGALNMTKHGQMGAFWSVWWSKGPSACVEHKMYPSGYFFVSGASRGCGGGVKGEPPFDGLRVGKALNTKRSGGGDVKRRETHKTCPSGHVLRVWWKRDTPNT